MVSMISEVVIATLVCFTLYFLSYRFYARFLATRIFGLRSLQAFKTPAHTLRDGVDYVPTRKSMLFGHHFASITGLAPMLGPALAVIWGWLPAMLWVVFGAVLVGCVHDFSALVLSLRARGLSMGKVAEGIIGARAKTLFHIIIFFGVALAMGVFVFVISKLLLVDMGSGAKGYPAAVTPSVGLMFVALLMGYLLYRKGWSLGPLAAIAFVLSLIFVYIGYRFPTAGFPLEWWPQSSTWIFFLLVYALAAAILPVWVLLQARDFVNSMLLYLGVGAAYVGLFVLAPDFQAPALRLEVAGAPSMFPFVFIIIACGAASGFHGLVSSGTTAKQINQEMDARSIGYGGMLAESLLGLLAVLATTAGFDSSHQWAVHYDTWGAAQGLAGKVGAFIDGSARFVSALGVPHALAQSFIAVIVVSFALTTLDSATRLLRYNIEEMAETLKIKHIEGNRYISSALAVVVIAVFAFYEIDGKPAALALWVLFGTTNQLLAGLTLLVATLYLHQRQKPIWFTLLPAVFVLTATMVAMTLSLMEFWHEKNWLLFGVGLTLWFLGVGIVLEAIGAFKRGRREAALAIA